MAYIQYKEEDINTILKALNSLNIRGVENARYIAFIDQVLRSNGKEAKEPSQEEEE